MKYPLRGRIVLLSRTLDSGLGRPVRLVTKTGLAVLVVLDELRRCQRIFAVN